MINFICLDYGRLENKLKKFDWTNLVPALFVISLAMLILLSITVGQMNAGLYSLEDFSNDLYDMVDDIDW